MTSTSSEVFCALNVTNLFTTGLLFKSNIFTHLPLDESFACMLKISIDTIVSKKN